MTDIGQLFYIFITKIILMQENEKIFYSAIGKVIKTRRKLLGYHFTTFCYENDISTTTLGCIENARRKVHLSSIFQVIEALNLSYSEFIELLEKQLPKNFSLLKTIN